MAIRFSVIGLSQISSFFSLIDMSNIGGHYPHGS